ncbi:MAG: hypothetical protein KAR20_18655, partial [Candidatus Heimdallarchaeota archaeon]|nr:hypothetical protein [Candidatus Heimdallarchaeota archaeon]
MHEENKYWKNHYIEPLKESIKLFDKAIEIDPHFELALYWKGSAFLGLKEYDSVKYYAFRILKINPESRYGYGLLGEYYKFTQNYDSAIENHMLSIKYSPKNSLTENHSEFMIGTIYCWYKNDYPRGLVYLNKGFDLNSDFVWSRCYMLGHTFLHIGDYMRANKYYRKMFEYETSVLGISSFSWALMVQTKYKEALNLLDTTCNKERDIMCDQMKFRIYISMKVFDQAEKYYNQFLSTAGTPNVRDSIWLAYLRKETGEKQLSRTILKNCRNSMEKRLVNTENWWIYLNLSSIHAILDENERALEYLAKAVDLGLQGGWHDFLEIDPMYENLWDDPEFKAIVKRAQEKKAAIRAQLREMEERGEI